MFIENNGLLDTGMAAVKDGKQDYQLETPFLICRTRTEVQPPPNGSLFY